MQQSLKILMLIKFLSALLVMLMPTPAITAECKSVARLVSLEGTVETKIKGDPNWQAARLEQQYCAGDALRISRNSRAAVRLINDTLLRLDSGSAVTFTRVIKKERSILDLLRGAVHFISRTPRSLEIRTPYVNAAIEGTEFVVRVSDTATDVTVYEGRVVARNDAGSVELIANQTARAETGQAPVRIAVAQPRDAVAWALYYPPLPDQPGPADTLVQQTIAAIVQNRLEEAASLAQQAIAADPQSAAAFMAQSYVDQARFDIPAALANSQKAAELAPQSALTQARLAEVWLMTGDTRAAQQAAAQAVALDPELSLTQSVLGFASLRRVNLDAARTAFEKAITLDSAAPLPRLGLGLVKIRRGDLMPGREEIETAALLDPNNALLRSYMGKAYYEEKRSRLASEQFAMAKELDPNDPTAWFYDSILLQSENRPVEALEAQQQAIALNDNRGVYRSRQLLDQDEAARNVALARIYSDLGFEKRALLEGTRALENDPANFSAHRFLSEIDASLPKRGIASESELLQSQLLQPLNKQTLNPKLSRLQLSDGPARFSYNEFNPLFSQNGPSLLFDTFIAEKNTWGNDLVLSYLGNRYAISLGQYHFESDGFHETDNLEKDILNLFGQFDLSESTMLQVEYTKDEQDNGDLQQRFFPQLFTDPNQNTKTDIDRWRMGFRHEFSPNSKIIGNVLFLDTEEDREESPFLAGLPLTTNNTDSDGHVFELQYLHKYKRSNLVTGISSQRQDLDSILTIFNPSAFSPTGDPLPPFIRLEFPSSFDLKHDTAYAYSYFQPLNDLNLTLGVSYDDAETREGEFDQFNPKLGLVWNLSTKTSLRAAAYRTFKRTLFAETLEPTQVAGFNQLYDDLNSTDAKRYGIALDQAFGDSYFWGMSYLYSDLTSRIFSINSPGTAFDFDTKNRLAEAYFYWTINPKFSLRFEYEYEEFDEPIDAFTNVLDLETHRFPIGLNYFHSKNISAGISATYYSQKGRYVDALDFINMQPEFDGEDDFWLVDTNLNYKLPKRRGKLSLGVKNLFDQSFQFEDRASNTQFNPLQNHNLFELSTDRLFYGKFSINF